MLADFLRDVLPPEGNYTLFTTKPLPNHTWFNSIDEIQEAVEAHAERKTPGVYYATATFTDQAVANGNKNSRTQANVVAKRSFFLDLDAGESKLKTQGPEKVYTTQKDAVLALRQFVVSTGLIPSYVVSSGEGVHVYWCLTEDITGPQWTVMALNLSRLFRAKGLKEDPTVTKDSCRVLRPIGVVHENGTTVRVVSSSTTRYSMQELTDKVKDLLADEWDEFPAVASADARTSSINKDLLVEGPPKSIGKIITKCAAMRHVALRRGNVEEPLWRAMLGVVKHTTEGDKAAHMLSKGHPSYDYAETQAKLDNWKTGPATCQVIESYCRAECGGCEHKGKIKSPISLGYMNDIEVAALPEEHQPKPVVQEATGQPWDSKLPEGFRVENVGSVPTLIYSMPVQQEDEDGNAITIRVPVPFTTDLFWFGNWVDADHTDEAAQVLLLKWTGREVKPYTLDQTLIANQQKLREFLASKSIILSTHKHASRAMEEYTKALLVDIKRVNDMPRISDRFGLYAEGNRLYCAHGEYVIEGDGSIVRAALSVGLRSAAANLPLPIPKSDTISWDKSVWGEHIEPAAKRHVEFLRKHYSMPGLEKLRLTIMLLLASPLMPFNQGQFRPGKTLPPGGLTVSLLSQETARGKTTAINMANLAFGNPEWMMVGNGRNGATALGRLERLGMAGTYPLGMDEMGNLTPAETVDLVYAIANGFSRVRAKREGGLIESNKWAMICAMSTNKSQRDLAAAASEETDAVQYRMLELSVENLPAFSGEQIDEFTRDAAGIASCAGALGAVIYREICALGLDTANLLVSTAANKARELIEAGQSDRFQFRALGCVLALHGLLRKAGLELFDRDELVATFKEANANTASYAKENALPTDGLSLLSMALHDLTPFTVITQGETRRSHSGAGYDEPLVVIPREVYARHVVGTRRTYVSATALRKWCNEHKVPIAKLLSDAKDSRVAEPVYFSRPNNYSSAFNLLKGMRASTEASTTCYAFNVEKLARLTGRSAMEFVADGAANNVVQLHSEETAHAPPQPTGPQGTGTDA